MTSHQAPPSTTRQDTNWDPLDDHLLASLECLLKTQKDRKLQLVSSHLAPPADTIALMAVIAKRKEGGERATKPGAISENACDDVAKKKEQSGAGASNPGAVHEKARMDSGAARKREWRSNLSSTSGAVGEDERALQEQRKDSRAANSSSQSKTPTASTGGT